MKRRLIFLIAIVAVCIVVGCAPPVGSIGGTAAVGLDSMWAVPYRVIYDINDLFLRYEDLLVFSSRRGAVFPIPVGTVAIGVIEDPDWSDEEFPVPMEDAYLLRKKGRKVIVVRYGGMSTQYSIDVRDPYDIGDPSDPSGGGGGGIIVIWGDD